MLRMEPVLEVSDRAGFTLWPVSPAPAFSFLPLRGGLSAAEIGTALMSIAAYNDVDFGDGSVPPPDPLGAFLHGLLTAEIPLAAGGLRLTNSETGVVVIPGCCNGFEDWRDWFAVLDGAEAWFGHDPSPSATLVGDVIQVAVDGESDDSPVIVVPVTQMLSLLANVERELYGFLEAATAWAAEHLPEHAGAIIPAIASALDLPASGAPPAPN